MTKERLKIPAASRNVKNHHIHVRDAVNDHILANGKAAQAGAQIVIAAAAHVGMAGQKKEALGNGVNQAVGNLDAAAFLGNVIPYVV